MNVFFFVFVLLFNYVFSESSIGIGYKLMVQVPGKYEIGGFIGGGYLLETKTVPNFRVALSIEGVNGKFSCSLLVFLGDVKVWDSGHYSRFYVTGKCLLEFTMDGDLRLKGPNETLGWKTGTSGQAVKRLQIQNTGNLVLMDEFNNVKWQSFNFPTDVILRGQQLDVATRLTSSRINSSIFYSFEIENNKVALYVNSGKLRYSYWNFQPSMNRSITYIKLSSKGLLLFDVKYKKIAQIPSQTIQPLKFLALKNETGNFGLYYYSPEKRKFEASFQALNNTCDLPNSCRPYGICTFSSTCSCILILTNDKKGSYDCSEGFSGDFCSGKKGEMLEIDNVSSVIKGIPQTVNISRDACSSLCLQDCKCAAALYFRNASVEAAECYLYRLVLGLKQVDKGTGFSYMVKVPKGIGQNHEKHNLKRWILLAVGVFDGLIVMTLVGGFVYWLIKRRSRGSRSGDRIS
ncbi:PAN domain-containing protein At5g03700-like [Trifolium pratense]|uniref:PAN domain-containing protein At5g03700-like n=1 Tax=Trifolium pratense TaxID=57577 RepID=UPI001E695312|nr:PAN domain-containing protein At5g03700-like [Trifolium pratense]